jgi:hypothetical protein
VMGIGLLGVGSRGHKVRIWAEFVFGGQHCDEIFITLKGLWLGESFEDDFGVVCMRRTQCNVHFGCELSTSSRTEKTHG